MVNFGDWTIHLALGTAWALILDISGWQQDEKAWSFKDPASFTGISLSYPIGFSDNLNANSDIPTVRNGNI